MVRVEINGFDETGTIGSNLKFVRVGFDESLQLRPFVYNILHFGSIAVTKSSLAGFTDDMKKKYVRMILSDQSIDVSQYVFTTDHQLDILRQFTMLEGKSLFSLRKSAVDAINGDDQKENIEKISSYLKRYEKTPFWMESFVKSYGFRMIVSDLSKTSRTLKANRREDVRVVSQVDGGFPFVCWWRSFLGSEGAKESGFSLERTPIYGITKGDEYYPAVSMAGNIAFITNNINGMSFPHVYREVPRMESSELNGFYEEFQDRACRPSYDRRILFYGRISTDLQYSIPYILHSIDHPRTIYEPYRLSHIHRGTIHSFYRDFGRRSNDLVIYGSLSTYQESEIQEEIKDEGIETHSVLEYVPRYVEFLDRLSEDADNSNLRSDMRLKVKTKIEKAKSEARSMK